MHGRCSVQACWTVFEAGDVRLQTTNLESPRCHTVGGGGGGLAIGGQRSALPCAHEHVQTWGHLWPGHVSNFSLLHQVDGVTALAITYFIFLRVEIYGKKKTRSLISDLLCEFIPEHSSNVPQKSLSRDCKGGSILCTFVGGWQLPPALRWMVVSRRI